MIKGVVLRAEWALGSTVGLLMSSIRVCCFGLVASMPTFVVGDALPDDSMCHRFLGEGAESGCILDRHCIPLRICQRVEDLVRVVPDAGIGGCCDGCVYGLDRLGEHGVLSVVVVEPGFELAKRVEDVFNVDTEQERLDSLVSKELEVVGADGVRDMVPPDVM